MFNRSCLFFMLLLIQAPVFALQAYGVTREELAQMPPYCTALKGKRFGLPKWRKSPLRNTIPAGCLAGLHHYCNGFKDMIRARKYMSVNETESRYWLHQAVSAFRSVAIRQDWASCPLRPEAFVNLGKAQLLQNGRKSDEATVNFKKAIELKSDYLPAYYALSDYYMHSGNKKQALEIVENGLRHVPNSKGLLRRFKELGGTSLPAPIVDVDKLKESDAPKDDATKQQRNSRKNTDASSDADSASDHPTSPRIGNANNPWCRFCPPP